MSLNTREDYYSPPLQWRFDSIVNLYRTLTSNKDNPDIDFSEFEQYPEIVKEKRLLQFLSERIKLNDSAAIDISVSFVVSPVYFHYSGYIRQSMAKRLKNVELSVNQIQHIITGVEDLIKQHKTGMEFKQIKKLYDQVKKK